MHKTELCFREMHHRLVHLEEKQAPFGPTDEQVERAVRKILAEKFSSTGSQPVEDLGAGRDHFVEDRNLLAFPKPILYDPASLIVDPESVPSKKYVETFQQLEKELVGFPNTKLNEYDSGDDDEADRANPSKKCKVSHLLNSA